MIMIIIVIIIMNKSQELTVFQGRQKLTSAENKVQKSDGRLQVWCSIQLSLHKEPPERVSKNLNRKFVLVGDTARGNPI